jgi:predicted PurR-regulated permease PerM
MATIGVATGIAYSLLGLPPRCSWPHRRLAEVIPIVVPFIGAIPAVLVATTISPETVVLTIAVYLAIQAVEGNVLVPMIMRNTVGLSPFLVLVSLLVGGTVGGILGAIVAVPVVAGVTVILDRLQDRETPCRSTRRRSRHPTPRRARSRGSGRPQRRSRSGAGVGRPRSARREPLRRLAHQPDVVSRPDP